MLIESPIFLGSGFPPEDGPRFAPLVEGNEHCERVGGQNRFVRVGIGAGYMHAQVHAARPGVNETSGDFHDVADDDRAIETDAADIGSQDLSAGPVGTAHKGGVVHPVHGASTVDFAAPVDVGRGREEPQCGLGCGAAVYCSAAMASSMRVRTGMRARAWRCRWSSRIVSGVHCATSTGSPVSSTATKIVKHCNV
jgi:hypothetical protein